MTEELPPAGWYPDPLRGGIFDHLRDRQRYFDGSEWTEHLASPEELARSAFAPPEEPATSTLPPEEPTPSTLPPVDPDLGQPVKSASNRRRTINTIILTVVAVFLLLLIAFVVVDTHNQEEVGKSEPAAQKSALTLLETIPVKGRAPKTGYYRDLFGPPITGARAVNGCDIRNYILRRDLSDVVTEADGCKVLSGVLHDPYTGKDVPFNREEGTDVLVHIDHVVALLDAWQKGAQQWDPAKRVQFATDPLNLLAVSGKANREKRASDVATWLPDNKDFRCDYVSTVVDVKAKYGLWMTASEHHEASLILTKCSSETPPSSGVLPSSRVLPSTGVLFPSSSANHK